VDVQKILAGDQQANVALQPGDMMVVPESRNRFAVLGAVNTPGTFPLTEGLRLVDAVAMAGGPTNRGRLTNVILVRVEGGQTRRIEVNLERALSGRDPEQNPALRNGDIVFVPDRMTIGQIGEWLNLFNLIRLMFGGF
jgi:polysaccharide export outer membrane protein